MTAIVLDFFGLNQKCVCSLLRDRCRLSGFVDACQVFFDSLLVVEPNMDVFHYFQEHKRGFFRLSEAAIWQNAEVLPTDGFCQSLVEFSLTTFDPVCEGSRDSLRLPPPVIRVVLVFLGDFRTLTLLLDLEVLCSLH